MVLSLASTILKATPLSCGNLLQMAPPNARSIREVLMQYLFLAGRVLYGGFFLQEHRAAWCSLYAAAHPAAVAIEPPVVRRS